VTPELERAKQARIDELHRCHPDETALLVIDMQRAFLEPGAALEVPAGREAIPKVKRLIDTCRSKRIPVIFTEFVHSTAIPCLRGDPFGPEHLPARPGEPTGLGLPSSNCLIGTGAATGPDSPETVAELAPRDDELVIRAHTYDKFYGTPLDLALRTAGVRYLLVTGVTTDVCVNSTVLAAATRDYRVTVVADGVASPWPELHDACLLIWEKKFARLRNVSELVREVEVF
jgi:biuret amidohydrolase